MSEALIAELKPFGLDYRAESAIREAEQYRALLKNAYALFSDHYLLDTKPDAIKRERAFLAFDKKLRELGIIGTEVN